MFFDVNILFLAFLPLASSPHRLILRVRTKNRAKVQQKMHICKKSEQYFQK